MSRVSSVVGALPLLALLLAVLTGCEGSDPQTLELVALERFGDQDSLIAGGGASSKIGYSASNESFLPTVRFARHDAASPERTVFLGDVTFAGGGSVTRLVVTDEAAAVVVGGGVRVVDLSDPSLPIEDLAALGNAADVAVAGRRVLAVVGSDLVLVDRDAPLTTTHFTPAGAPTALMATQGVFLAFTTTGYVLIDPSEATPSFDEVIDPVLGNIQRAFADGTGAVAAGPGTSFGRSRVLRLELANPAAPVVVRGHEVAGTYVAFAWDGGSTSVIAVHGGGDGSDARSFHEGYVLRERADGFRAEGVPLTFWSQSGQPLAAHANHLFAVQAGGVALLRIR